MDKCLIKITNEDEAPFEYEGFWHKADNCHKLFYVHEDDGARSDYELTFSENELKIKRVGETTMAILIRPDQKTRCIIKLPQGKLMGDIETSFYELEEYIDSLRLKISYDMIFQGERNCRKLIIEAQRI